MCSDIRFGTVNRLWPASPTNRVGFLQDEEIRLSLKGPGPTEAPGSLSTADFLPEVKEAGA